MGEKKKYKAHILKLVPCILKYLRPIFCPLKTRLKTGAKTQMFAEYEYFFGKTGFSCSWQSRFSAFKTVQNSM